MRGQVFPPEVAGLSVMGATLPVALLILEELRRAWPRTTLLLGGPGMNGTDLAVLERFPQVDAVVRGEAEITLVELCELPRPDALQGRSLLDAIEDKSSWESSRPFAFSSTRFSSTVVTQDGWQLILPSELGECQESMSTELYHLPSDPFERHNRAAEHPELVEQLTEYITARLDMGLDGDAREDITFTPTNQDALLALGYIDDGIVEAAISKIGRAHV